MKRYQRSIWFVLGFLVGLWVALSTAAVLGPQQILAVYLRYADRPNTLHTVAELNDLVFNQFGGMIQTDSWGQASFVGQAYGYWDLPHNYAYYCPTYCHGDLMKIDADALIQAHGLDPHSYRTIYYVVNDVGLSGGSAGQGAQISDVNLIYTTVAHEGFHTFGFSHTGRWYCPGHQVCADYVNLGNEETQQDIQGPSSWTQGDWLGPMSGGPHCSTYWKRVLGWLPPSATVTVTSSGTYTLYENMEPNLAAVHEIVIPFPDNQYFYTIEWRSGIGVIVRFRRWPFHVPQQLLDTCETFLIAAHPVTTWPIVDTTTWPMQVGDTINDPWRGIHISVAAIGATTATINITLTPTCQ